MLGINHHAWHGYYCVHCRRYDRLVSEFVYTNFGFRFHQLMGTLPLLFHLAPHLAVLSLPAPPRLLAPLIQPGAMTESVQVFGRKRTAVAVAYCKKGTGQMKINGCPYELIEPEILRFKVREPPHQLHVLCPRCALPRLSTASPGRSGRWFGGSWDERGAQRVELASGAALPWSPGSARAAILVADQSARFSCRAWHFLRAVLQMSWGYAHGCPRPPFATRARRCTSRCSSSVRTSSRWWTSGFGARVADTCRRSMRSGRQLRRRSSLTTRNVRPPPRQPVGP